MKILANHSLRSLALSALIFCGLGLNCGCLPVALAQTAFPDPVDFNSPHASEINAYVEADKKAMPPQNAVLFIGSSSILLWDTLDQDFPEIPVINRGFGGSLVYESTLYADRIAIPYKPKMIVMFAGTNDLAYGGKSPEQVFEDYKKFVAKIHGSLPDVRLVYLAISPTKARWNQENKILQANHLIQDWTILNNSPANKLTFINTHDSLLTIDGQPPVNLEREDGLHFNKAGYKVWSALMKPTILKLAEIEGVERLDKAAEK